MKLIIGLTGPTGAGKTTALEVALKNGFYCIDCDKVAKNVTETNKLCLKEIKEAFSSEVFNGEKLNRAALAQAAFKDKESTELLNKTVLPFVVSEILSLVEKSQSEKIVLDAPTLFESGTDEICNVCIGILSDRQIRKERIIARDNLSEQAALLRIGAGKSDEFYKENCDICLYNNEDSLLFSNNFQKVINSILKEYGYE